MSPLIKVTLKKGKEQSVKRFHPWIFSGAIESMGGKPSEGDLVDVYSKEGEFLGRGHCQIGSITVRLLTFIDEPIDLEFWEKRLASAYAFRNSIGLSNSTETNVYRLVHGEGDMLPGLIIDYYNGTAIIQTHSVGMHLVRNEISLALQKVLGNKLQAVYDKSEGCIPFKAGIEHTDAYLWGQPASFEVLENGKKFSIDWLSGQKTGFFIDQRENRQLLQHYAKNRSVLNMFAYTGGFSVYALAGGASLVHTVDSSKKAIELANSNVALNFTNPGNHEAFATDAFDFLKDIKNKYDLIILDPPAFAKHTSALNNALQGYKRLNASALEQIEPGGILFTFSCSQVVDRENFRKAVFAAAASTGRNVRIMHQLTQPADHPINIYHPEGEYLKGLVLQVE